MKLWLSLLFLLAACGSDGLEPKQTESSASGSRPTSSTSRVHDTGGGIHTIETSQRRIDTTPAASAAANGKSPSTAARAGSSPSKSESAARKREREPESESESEPDASSAPQRSTDGEDAGPGQRDAGARGASGEPAVMMSGAAGFAGAAGAAGSAGAAGMSGDPNMPVMTAMNTGSCCVASDKPGCGTPETQACVCQLQPRCCMTAWDETCTFIVAQKFCQPGVRQCVCGSGMGQWQQTECCAQSWTDTCDSVALNKCNARAGCF